MVYIVFCCLLLRLSLHPGLRDRNLQLSPRPTDSKGQKEEEDFSFSFYFFSSFSGRNDERHNIVCALKEEKKKTKTIYIYCIIIVGVEKMSFKSSGIGSAA